MVFKPYSCRSCGRRFHTREGRNIHYERHNGWTNKNGDRHTDVGDF